MTSLSVGVTAEDDDAAVSEQPVTQSFSSARSLA